MDSQIRYLAIVSEQPDTLAHFYSTYFAMRELGRSDAGDVALTDGFYNISILKPRDGAAELGISHLGITIDDIGQDRGPAQRFCAQDGHSPRRRRPVPRRLLCDRSLRPGRELFPLISSTRRRSSVRFPCIRHIAVCVPNNDEVLDFYVNVFGFRESTTSKKIRAQNRVVRWAADGETAMAILPDRERRDMNERESPRDGLNHFGWLVTDIEHFLNSLPEGCISQRPSSRPMAEYRGFDPDRNPFDISQDKGYEIDIDRWVHG